LEKSDIQSVVLLGSDSEIKWIISEDGLHIEAPDEKPCQYAYAFKITGQIM
jgi:alpha-L-fucosidase